VLQSSLLAVTGAAERHEAWSGYSRFNPLYEGRYAMHRGERGDDEPTQFATQSIHKLIRPVAGVDAAAPAQRLGVWTYGPYLLVLEGEKDASDYDKLVSALEDVGAK
jgi:hypothetical protein